MASNINIKDFLKIPGEVRGDVLRTDLEYIKKKEGVKKWRKIESEIKSFGLNVSLENLQSTRWYPIGYKSLILELAREFLNWKDKDIIEMGVMASKQSFITRTILRYFVSVEKSFAETPKYWSKYWNAGEFIPRKIDTKKRYLIIKLKDFKVHPDVCLYFRGHFKAIAQMLLKSEQIKIEETKCLFQGDDCHEFKITW